MENNVFQNAEKDLTLLAKKAFDIALRKGYIDAPKSNAGINGFNRILRRRKETALAHETRRIAAAGEKQQTVTRGPASKPGRPDMYWPDTKR